MGAILIHNDLIYIPLSMLSEGHSSRRKQGKTRQYPHAMGRWYKDTKEVNSMDTFRNSTGT